ncbi:hypothetical protein KsCSTR_49640 [Candidatus Kuenenia stuttgartiensis]|jgi:hypothetical protein|uniref:Uncharacterized protein n=1 Tax=Kuenenia stuttgartiensis TaxID=174633 RepID=A0A6G7GXZ8_KUEST|nr:hypothetical protein KsCSTR_49640 [Candidatus Kuenenia stuttgartiensis]
MKNENDESIWRNVIEYLTYLPLSISFIAI